MMNSDKKKSREVRVDRAADDVGWTVGNFVSSALGSNVRLVGLDDDDKSPNSSGLFAS